MFSLFETVFLVGLLYSLCTIGISLSFRVLNYPDLTLEGSVILGGSLSYLSLVNGFPPVLSLLVGFAGGAAAGALTSVLHLFFKVSKLLSGIITSAILYSINIRLMGGLANVRFENKPTIFTSFGLVRSSFSDLVLLLILISVIIVLITIFFKTKLGYLFRVLGDNENFLISLGVSPRRITIFGLVFSNSIIGLGGAILIQYKNSCDINMSVGLLVVCLASMVLGESLIKAKKIRWSLVGNVAGTICYNFVIGLVLYSWSSSWDKYIWASDVKLLTGLLLIVPALIQLKKKDKFKLFNSEW